MYSNTSIIRLTERSIIGTSISEKFANGPLQEKLENENRKRNKLAQFLSNSFRFSSQNDIYKIVWNKWSVLVWKRNCATIDSDNQSCNIFIIYAIDLIDDRLPISCIIKLYLIDNLSELNSAEYRLRTN